MSLPPARSQYADGRPAARLRLPARDHGPVLCHGPEPYDRLGARDVVVFEHDGRYYLHYDAAGPDGWVTALASSDDGLSWRKHGPVLSLGGDGDRDRGSASYGVPVFDGERWHLFYLGTPNTSPPPERIPAFPYLTCKAVADSPAGPWTKQPELDPMPPVPGSWFEQTIVPGHILRSADGWHQFFSGARKDGDSIQRTLGHATTRDLDSAWTIASEPILPVGEQVENSSVYYEPANGLWFLFTNHVAIHDDLELLLPPEHTAEYTDAIWVYWTADPGSWDPGRKAVVLDGATSRWSTGVIGLPSVLRIGDRLAVYYDGRADGGLGHCERDIGLCWLDLPLEPPLGHLEGSPL